MSRSLSLTLVVSMFLATACAGTRVGQAPKRPDGSPIAMLVHIDDGLTSDDPARVNQRKEVASYLENDLLKVLARTGYTATRSEDPSAAAGPGRHLLRVKIVRYDAGSKAARILVGAGAGAASIETHFELIGDQGTPLVTGDPEASSGFGGDWNDAVRTANEQTVKAINDGLRRGT